MTIYLVWFIPQVFLNFKRKDTEGLSMLMHGILCIAYLSDLVYGFGLNMQWQYRTVTIVGLCSLSIQHYQFGRYGLHRLAEKYTYLGLNLIFFVLLLYAIYAIKLSFYGRSFYDFAGMLANACYLSYMLPQTIKNYVNKSTLGLSVYFVFIAIILNICDSTSAWTLGWDYPSKIGPAFSLAGNSILLFQIIYYDKRDKQFSRLVANS
jgi:uncharacterized protein with PQ loop repeat